MSGADGQVPSPEFSVEQSVSLTVGFQPLLLIYASDSAVGQPNPGCLSQLLDRLAAIRGLAMHSPWQHS